MGWRSSDSKHEGEVWGEVARAVTRRWRHLGEDELDRLLEQAAHLDRSRYWEGLDGLIVSPTMRAVIATHACVLTVNIGLGALVDVTSILVAPTSAVRTTRHALGGSIVAESDACVLGQALLHGPVRISWDRAAAELETTAETSVLLHEFAHKVDMADGVADGTPPLGDRRRTLRFEETAIQTLERLRDGSVTGPLRAYGATNRSELFAVATEAFFLRPHDLHAEVPALYGELAGFYRQDPAGGRAAATERVAAG